MKIKKNIKSQIIFIKSSFVPLIINVKILIPFLFCFMILNAQDKISSSDFTFGVNGRVGFGQSPTIKGHTGVLLNLLGQGFLGGTLSQGDYIDFQPTYRYRPTSKNSTDIDVKVRLAFYSTNNSFLGNVNSKSLNGVITSLPEAYVEAKNIIGSNWSAWAGARYMRYDDIHIADYFYFDDHSAEGFGVKFKNTSVSMYFPAAIDTTSSNATPYSYTNIIDGNRNLTYRQREVVVLEHTFKVKKQHEIKLLAEYHSVPKINNNEGIGYPSDKGYVFGAKLSSNLATVKQGSYNQFAVRYGGGIANGGDNGNSQTWRTYGAPNLKDGRYTGAYSFTAVEHLLLNFNNRWSTNFYGVYINSKGGASSNHQAIDLYGREIYNKKLDVAFGNRLFYYVYDWFHFVSELHYTSRKNGNNPTASMVKFTLAPTLVPTAERNPWARPHIRLIASVARYNNFAKNSLASSFLLQAGKKRIGTYFGIRSEWWIM